MFMISLRLLPQCGMRWALVEMVFRHKLWDCRSASSALIKILGGFLHGSHLSSSPTFAVELFVIYFYCRNFPTSQLLIMKYTLMSVRDMTSGNCRFNVEHEMSSAIIRSDVSIAQSSPRWSWKHFRGNSWTRNMAFMTLQTSFHENDH